MVSDLLSIGDATEAGGCKKPEVGASVTIFGSWTRWNGGYWPGPAIHSEWNRPSAIRDKAAIRQA
jgi:hypothetical protein